MPLLLDFFSFLRENAHRLIVGADLSIKYLQSKEGQLYWKIVKEKKKKGVKIFNYEHLFFLNTILLNIN